MPPPKFIIEDNVVWIPSANYEFEQSKVDEDPLGVEEVEIVVTRVRKKKTLRKIKKEPCYEVPVSETKKTDIFFTDNQEIIIKNELTEQCEEISETNTGDYHEDLDGKNDDKPHNHVFGENQVDLNRGRLSEEHDSDGEHKFVNGDVHPVKEDGEVSREGASTSQEVILIEDSDPFLPITHNQDLGELPRNVSFDSSPRAGLKEEVIVIDDEEPPLTQSSCIDVKTEGDESVEESESEWDEEFWEEEVTLEPKTDSEEETNSADRPTLLEESYHWDSLALITSKSSEQSKEKNEDGTGSKKRRKITNGSSRRKPSSSKVVGRATEKREAVKKGPPVQQAIDNVLDVASEEGRERRSVKRPMRFKESLLCFCANTRECYCWEKQVMAAREAASEQEASKGVVSLISSSDSDVSVGSEPLPTPPLLSVTSRSALPLYPPPKRKRSKGGGPSASQRQRSIALQPLGAAVLPPPPEHNYVKGSIAEREKHTLSERSRREELRQLYNSLRDSIEGIQQNAAKIKILTEATKEINNLKDTECTLIEMLEREKKKRERLLALRTKITSGRRKVKANTPTRLSSQRLNRQHAKIKAKRSSQR